MSFISMFNVVYAKTILHIDENYFALANSIFLRPCRKCTVTMQTSMK